MALLLSDLLFFYLIKHFTKHFLGLLAGKTLVNEHVASYQGLENLMGHTTAGTCIIIWLCHLAIISKCVSYHWTQWLWMKTYSFWMHLAKSPCLQMWFLFMDKKLTLRVQNISPEPSRWLSRGQVSNTRPGGHKWPIKDSNLAH